MKLLPSKRRLKRIAIGLGVVIALLLIVNGLFAWWTERQWQNRLAAIRAAGDPASIADLAPKSIPDEENAAVYIENIDPTVESLYKDFVRFKESDVGQNYEEMYDRGESPTPEQSQAIKTILDAHSEILIAVDAAVVANKYASGLDYSRDYHTFMEEQLETAPQIRAVARYYDWKMRVLVDEGRVEEAVQEGLKMLRLIRLYLSEPNLVNHLTSIACQEITIGGIDRALRAGPINVELRKMLDDELKLHDDPQHLVNALKTERALVSSSFNSHTRHVIPLTVLGWPIKRYYIRVFDFYDEQLGLAAEPWHLAHGKIGRSGTPDSLSGFGALADTLLPAFQATYDASNRVRAIIRALRIHNALGAFREQHGREAEGLDELPLSKEAVIDLFSGAPMKTKLTDEGWIIYTVFWNGVDDGGDFRELKDYGLAPVGYPGP